MNALGVALSVWLSLLGPAAHQPQRHSISIAQFSFRPSVLTVTTGDTVVWTNEDVFRHTATSDSAAWSSPELAPGERFSVVLRRPGRYPFHCAAHPVMQAVIVVQ